MTGRRIPEFVAITVVTHISVHVCVIMADIYRSGAPVMGREITPMPRGVPGHISRAYQVGIYRGHGNIHRLDDIFGPINIWGTYNLDTCVGVNRRDLRNESGDILIHVVGKNCLDDKDVRIALHRLHNPQVIYITVTVEIKIRQHIGRIVEQILKFLNCCRLCECRTYSLKVKAKGNVFADCRDMGGGSCSRCPRNGHRSAVGPDIS